MPEAALRAFHATLDDAQYIADRLLTPPDGTRQQNATVRRTCVMLCHTAWEIYTEDSIVWVATRAAYVRTDDDVPHTLPTKLQSVLAGARSKLADLYTSSELDACSWSELLELELRRRVHGYRAGTGTHRGGINGPSYDEIGNYQRGVFGTNILAEVTIAGQPAK